MKYVLYMSVNTKEGLLNRVFVGRTIKPHKNWDQHVLFQMRMAATHALEAVGVPPDRLRFWIEDEDGNVFNPNELKALTKRPNT